MGYFQSLAGAIPCNHNFIRQSAYDNCRLMLLRYYAARNAVTHSTSLCLDPSSTGKLWLPPSMVTTSACGMYFFIFSTSPYGTIWSSVPDTTIVYVFILRRDKGLT